MVPALTLEMVPFAIKRQAMRIAQTHAHANLHTCPAVATETGRACALIIAECVATYGVFVAVVGALQAFVNIAFADIRFPGRKIRAKAAKWAVIKF